MRPKKRNPVPLPKPQRTDRIFPEWKRQEKDAARIIDGETTRGSGCGKDKGDIKNRFARGEAKTTQRESISVKMEVLCKLCRDAQSKVPIFVFGFDNMPKRFSSDWFAIPAEKFDVVCSALTCVANDDLEGAKTWLKSL